MKATGTDILTSAVVHDVLVYDLHYKGYFILSNEIKFMTGAGPVRGPAYPVTGAFNFNRLAKYEEKARVIDMLDSFQEGDIEVLQPRYDGPVGTWGGFTARLVREFGCAGAVVDGYTRDVEQLRELGFPLCCKGTNVVNGFGSGWQIADFNCSVQMPGVLGTPVEVRPGDWVIGDEDGVVVVPVELLDDVVDHATKRLEREEDLVGQLKNKAMTPDDWKKTIFDW